MVDTVRPLGPEHFLSFPPFLCPRGPRGPRCAAWTTAAAGADPSRWIVPSGVMGLMGGTGGRDWALLRALRRGGGPKIAASCPLIRARFFAHRLELLRALRGLVSRALQRPFGARALLLRSKLPKFPEEFRPPARSKDPEPRAAPAARPRPLGALRSSPTARPLTRFMNNNGRAPATRGHLRPPTGSLPARPFPPRLHSSTRHAFAILGASPALLWAALSASAPPRGARAGDGERHPPWGKNRWLLLGHRPPHRLRKRHLPHRGGGPDPRSRLRRLGR